MSTNPEWITAPYSVSYLFVVPGLWQPGERSRKRRRKIWRQHVRRVIKEHAVRMHARLPQFRQQDNVVTFVETTKPYTEEELLEAPITGFNRLPTPLRFRAPGGVSSSIIDPPQAPHQTSAIQVGDFASAWQSEFSAPPQATERLVLPVQKQIVSVRLAPER